MRKTVLVFGALMTIASVLAAASLDKAKSLRSNGLREEAKRELVEVLFGAESSDESKAEALLLLGDIAFEEKNFSAARENWTQLAAKFPDTPFALAAHAQLETLAQSPASVTATGPPPFQPGTVLVIGPSSFPWAAPQVAGSVGKAASSFEGSLDQAVKTAATDSNVVGILEVGLEVDVVFESGRIVCYSPKGARVWEKVVRVSSPGGQEHIARNFVRKLSAKIKGKTCP
jgi:hypothetical protein